MKKHRAAIIIQVHSFSMFTNVNGFSVNHSFVLFFEAGDKFSVKA